MLPAYYADRMMPVPDGCVLWTAYTFTGYGIVGQVGPNRGRVVHRVLWELAHGPVPDGLHLDHLCGQRACVNIAHLEAVTPAVNSRRAMGMPDDGATCGQGHDDWYTPPSGKWRRCRPCSTISKAAWRGIPR